MVRVDAETAARLLVVKRVTVFRLAKAWEQGRTYAATSPYRGGRQGEGAVRLTQNRRLRGNFGQAMAFRPGERRGFPRHWDPERGVWWFEMKDLARWAVRRYNLTTAEDANIWLASSGYAPGWPAMVMAAAHGLLVEQEQAVHP